MSIKLNPALALRVAGSIFLLVAIAHLIRVALKMQIIAAGTAIPLRGSIAGFLFGMVLAIWMFAAARSK